MNWIHIVYLRKRISELGLIGSIYYNMFDGILHRVLLFHTKQPLK